MSKAKAPKPSQQELQLLESQKQMLDLQRQQLTRQQSQQDLLAPILYESMGIKPQYNAQGEITGYERFTTDEQQLYKLQMEAMLRQQPMQERLQQQYLTLAEQQAESQRQQQAWQQELAPEMREQVRAQTRLQQQALDYQDVALRQYQEQQRLQPLLYEASGVRPIYDEAGNITSFAWTEQGQARQDYEAALLERQRKALAGELPGDPTLERALAEGETQLRAQLQAQLGTGYETSSPGIQALGEFRQRAAEARANVAHGQMVSAQQVLQSQQQLDERQRGQAYGGRGLLGEYGLQPVAFGGQVQAPTQSLFTAGSPAAAAAGYQGALSGQFGTLGEYGRMAQGYGQLAGGMRQQRLGDYQMRQQLAGEYGSTIGTITGILGAAAGAYFGGPAGASAGYSLGSTAGGYAGRAMY